MSNLQIAKTLVAGLLLSAGAAQAAAPASVTEVPDAWYADQIVVRAHTPTPNVSFPAAAYEHGLTIPYAGVPGTRPTVAGGRVTPPTSAQEHGPKL
jgi:hypothetical protein